MSDRDFETNADRDRRELLHTVSRIEGAIENLAAFSGQDQQTRLMNMHEVKRDLKTIASATLWGAIFLLVICITVLYKSFKG